MEAEQYSRERIRTLDKLMAMPINFYDIVLSSFPDDVLDRKKYETVKLLMVNMLSADSAIEWMEYLHQFATPAIRYLKLHEFLATKDSLSEDESEAVNKFNSWYKVSRNKLANELVDKYLDWGESTVGKAIRIVLERRFPEMWSDKRQLLDRQNELNQGIATKPLDTSINFTIA